MVGKTGFEPATPWSQTKCSTKLSHFPLYGALEGIRTPDLLVRSQTLYPTELRAHNRQYTQLNTSQKNLKNGGSSGNRTSDTGIFSPLLYRLSYEAIMAVPTGLEPAIFCVTGRRVNRLHHETTLVAGRGFEPLTFGL